MAVQESIKSLTECFIDGTDQSDSQLTYSGANSNLTANACSGILQVVFVNLSNGVNWIDMLAVCDTDSTLAFIDVGINFYWALMERN